MKYLLLQLLHFVNLLHQQLLGDKMRHVGENLLHEGQATRAGASGCERSLPMTIT